MTDSKRSNIVDHFHILVEVPQRPDPSALPDDAGLLAKARSCLGDKLADDLERQLDLHRKQGNTTAAEELREEWFGRVWALSAFMKALKQRFCPRSAQTMQITFPHSSSPIPTLRSTT